MSIFAAMNTAYGLEEAYGSKDCTSAAMKDAIKEWFKLYYEQETTKTSDPCQRIAYTVVSKLAKTCFGEYSAVSATDDPYVNDILDALDLRKHRAMQAMLTGGEAFLKPYMTPTGWAFNVIRRDNVLVFSRDAQGVPNDIGCTERIVRGNSYYTLLERRTLDGRGLLTLKNHLYQSDTAERLGRMVPLGSLPEYENLVTEYTYTEPLGGLGLVYLRTNIENVVDGSADGVSVYAAAVGLIHNIDHNEAQINGEFDRGETRIVASADMLQKDKSGKKTLVDNIFTGLDDDPSAVGVTIFSPQLREESFLNRKREYLRNVESVIGIKRGLLSEVEAQERTATEVTSSEGEYNLTILDLQSIWENAVREACVLCGRLGRLYKYPRAHDIDPEDINVDWGNGVLYDEDKTWADYKDMVMRGLIKPEIAVGWRFGMPTDTDADLAVIRKKYMPTIQELISGTDSSDAFDADTDTDIVNEAEKQAGKTLNGAQTQSLLAVIAQYQAGTLSIGQAINILKVSIGINKEEAQSIIEGAVE